MRRFFALFILSVLVLPLSAERWVRVNLLGYLPDAVKVAVLMSEDAVTPDGFVLHEAISGAAVQRFDKVRPCGAFGQMQSTFRLDFSAFKKSGSYYIEAAGVKSPVFRINADAYDGTADFLLNYMRQQRCGYNPWLKDSCHVHDGYIVCHPTRSGEKIDATGGWHDATDYLQYTTTSANAVYQMMLAYTRNPEAFGDAYGANGSAGANGIPDIVDEIKWGMDWLCKMNPEPGMLFNQIADDRDHAGFRLPTRDSVDYGWGKGLGRPVYFITGQPEGLLKYKNHATGKASAAGKFASCFAKGAELLKPYYPAYAAKLAEKADAAYQEGVKFPGVAQTAPGNAPYFYEEDNWTDDMQLAAAELYASTGKRDYLNDAVRYGRMEPVTPWMGADSARHYEWYPFVNIGHYLLSNVTDAAVSKEFRRNLRTGIERVSERAEGDPFLYGIPGIWCSNNLVAAMITQCRLYRETTGDTRYLEMESALRDWLFGCNPWGTSMVAGLPRWGDTPEHPHSSYVVKGIGYVPGALIDGPVYATIFNSLYGVSITQPDPYSRFQARTVYHDDVNDYSTNEPTMDGTASLTYYLSALQNEGRKERTVTTDRNTWDEGGIIRTDSTKKVISLVFTAADKHDGEEVILKTLRKHHIIGTFFFTGGFYRDFPEVVQRVKSEGHYVGSHSNNHLLYNDWTKRDSTLVTKEQFTTDLLDSYKELAKAGIQTADAPLFMPPYEWYNDDIAAWTKELGLQVINYTPGTGSNADYTTPDMKNYRSSDVLFDRIMQYEKQHTLKGNIMLIHFGTDNARTDKFYNRLDELITRLEKKGYVFKSLREAIGM